MSRDFVAEAVEIIGPEQERYAACADRIAWTLTTLPRFGLEVAPPTNGALRKEIKAFRNAVERARHKARGLSPLAKALLFQAGEAAPETPETFIAQRVTVMIDALIDGKGIPEGRSGAQLQPITIGAAEIAYALMVEFSSKRPRSTTAGPYQLLAQRLIEAITGMSEVSVGRACDAVLARARAAADMTFDDAELDRQIAEERTRLKS